MDNIDLMLKEFGVNLNGGYKYLKQAIKIILDKDYTLIPNSDYNFSKFIYSEVAKLNNKATVKQIGMAVRYSISKAFKHKKTREVFKIQPTVYEFILYIVNDLKT